MLIFVYLTYGVSPGNATNTYNRPTHGTPRMIHRTQTVTLQQQHNYVKESNRLFFQQDIRKKGRNEFANVDDKLTI